MGQLSKLGRLFSISPKSVTDREINAPPVYLPIPRAPEQNPGPIACEANSSVCTSLKINPKWHTIDTLYVESYKLDTARDFLFHKPCEQGCRASETRLCEVCHHMRLGHILQCSRLHFSLGFHLTFNIGYLGDMQERSQRCELCAIFSQGVREDQKISRYSRVDISIQTFGDQFELGLVVNKGQPGKVIPQTQSVWDVYTSPNEELMHLVQEPRPAEMVNWGKALEWLKGDCDKACQVKPLQDQPPGFRLIDTQRGCITISPPVCHYATLSYVWGNGNKSDLEATSDTIDRLTTQNFLFGDTTPLTIRDAITACQKLGIPYLWVDRLCIMQDDKVTKDAQINAMGGIYSHSYLTLVALQGHTADDGLPGVSKPRETVRTSYRTQEVLLVKQHESFDMLAHGSKWASRGWTFQEGLLSPRLLSFSERGLFYECSHSDLIEFEDRTVIQDSRIQTHETGNKIKSTLYQDQLKLFTQREFSFESDVLRALKGALTMQYGSSHYFGLPYNEFHKAIRWQTTSGKYIQRRPLEGEVFPSWSWSSVKGEIELIDDKYDDFTLASSLALVAVPSDSSTTQSLHFLRHHNRSQTYAGWRCSKFWPPSQDYRTRSAALAVVGAWILGCYPVRVPDHLDIDTTWQGYLEAIETSNWSSIDELCDSALGLGGGVLGPEDIELKIPNGRVKQARDCGGLLIYTQSLSVQLLPPSHQHNKSVPEVIKLQIPSGDIIGWLHPKSTDTEQLHREYSCRPDKYFDVLALSLLVMDSTKLESAHLQMTGSHGDQDLVYWRDSLGEKLSLHGPGGVGLAPLVYSLKDPPSGDRPVVFVADLMVVDTDERTGISKRIALGRAFLSTWIKARPRFNTFLIAQ